MIVNAREYSSVGERHFSIVEAWGSIPHTSNFSFHVKKLIENMKTKRDFFIKKIHLWSHIKKRLITTNNNSIFLLKKFSMFLFNLNAIFI